jgi:hypothetical protein
MPKSYRLISGNANEVNRQLTIMSAQNRAGAGPTEKPILMSTATVEVPNRAALVHLYLYVVVEGEQA